MPIFDQSLIKNWKLQGDQLTHFIKCCRMLQLLEILKQHTLLMYQLLVWKRPFFKNALENLFSKCDYYSIELRCNVDHISENRQTYRNWGLYTQIVIFLTQLLGLLTFFSNNRLIRSKRLEHFKEFTLQDGKSLISFYSEKGFYFKQADIQPSYASLINSATVLLIRQSIIS